MQFLEAIRVLTDKTNMTLSYCSQKARKLHICDSCNKIIDMCEVYFSVSIGSQNKGRQLFCKLCNKCMDEV